MSMTKNEISWNVRIWATETERIDWCNLIMFDPTQQPVPFLRPRAEHAMSADLIEAGATPAETWDIEFMTFVPGCPDFKSAAECLNAHRDAVAKAAARA